MRFHTPPGILADLRVHMGERSFRRLALHLTEPCDRLLFTHERALDAFHATHAHALLPADVTALRQLFVGVVEREVLAAHDVPAWCVIEELGGRCPVQGWGRCEGRPWFFHARGEGWALYVSRDRSLTPDDVVGLLDCLFHEEPYGDERDDAGHMPEDEARFFLVRELTRFRASLGPD